MIVAEGVSRRRLREARPERVPGAGTNVRPGLCKDVRGGEGGQSNAAG